MKLFFLGLLIADLFAQQVPTYKVVSIPKKYALGLVRHKAPLRGELDKRFDVLVEAVPKAFHLRERAALAPIKDQGQCGSCVYNATMAVIEDNYRLRGVVFPSLSRQFIMDCGAPWSCDGSFFEKVADGIVAQGGTAKEDDYPYRAQNQSCKGKPSQLYGQLVSHKLISTNAKSIIGALLAGYPVAVTVGADNRWMSYGGGIYNGCTQQDTNHEVAIEGYDCETSVDASGHCQFDAQGNLPAGVGIWHVRNSWGTGWGESGWMRSKMTSSSGYLCNRLAEEAGIVEPTVQPKPPEPPAPPTPPTPFTLPTWIWYVVVGIIALVNLINWICDRKART